MRCRAQQKRSFSLAETASLIVNSLHSGVHEHTCVTSRLKLLLNDDTAIKSPPQWSAARAKWEERFLESSCPQNLPGTPVMKAHQWTVDTAQSSWSAHVCLNSSCFFCRHAAPFFPLQTANRNWNCLCLRKIPSEESGIHHVWKKLL